jgi:aquaglyceroporin related protein
VECRWILLLGELFLLYGTSSDTDANLQIPMVAPFLGCTFGAFLYDVFIYTGPSPINTPWLGLKQLRPSYAMRARREHIRREKEEGIV